MNLFKSTTTFSFFTILSRILGYIRDILIAIFLGSGILADTFFVAFRIPNTFRRLFAEGSFNSAFVPSYASELSKGKSQANDFANILKTRNDTKIIYLEFPIFGGISETAANVALEIWNENPDLYFDIHNGLMELGSSMNKQNIINLLNQLDLEGEKIFNFSETQPYDKTIQLNKKLAKELGLRGTPASIINNTMIPGYIKEQKIIELLDGAKTAS